MRLTLRALLCSAVLAASAVSASAPMTSGLKPRMDFDPACPLQCITTCFTVEPCVSICVLTQCVLQMGGRTVKPKPVSK